MNIELTKYWSLKLSDEELNAVIAALSILDQKPYDEYVARHPDKHMLRWDDLCFLHDNITDIVRKIK